VASPAVVVPAVSALSGDPNEADSLEAIPLEADSLETRSLAFARCRR
jgi:hypothetical protein